METFATAEEFLSELGPAKKGCAVAEALLPGMNGFALIAAIAARAAWISAIVVSADVDSEMTVQALQAGAVYVVKKPFDAQILLNMVRDAVGGFFTAARLRAEAAAALTRLAALSPREREVLNSLALGLAIKEIAKSMSLSPKSVETYRARLGEKLAARNSAALMRIALLISLMEPPVSAG